MNIALNKIFMVFAESNDEDLATEKVFQTSFSNVVNFTLLLYCLLSGLHSLYSENIALAMTAMVFCLLFLFYFLQGYLLKSPLWAVALNRVVIFAFFATSYINCSVMGFASVVSVVYSFVAIILHGRKLGVLLSVALVGVECAYTALAMPGIIDVPFRFAATEVVTIIGVQTVCIFVYYVAIRWLTSLIYDRMNEVNNLLDEVKVKKELVDMLTTGMRSEMKDVLEATSQLLSERLNPRQLEMAQSVKASVLNMLDDVDSIFSASQYNIRPIQKECVVFNIYNMLTNVLVLFNNKANGVKHQVMMSPEVPRNVVGNSIMTRQILLSMFDALSRNANMSKTPADISVSLNDINADGIVLCFTITSRSIVEVDHRDLTSFESKAIDALQLNDVKRLIMAAGGDMSVEVVADMLHVEFTLPYKEEQRTSSIGDQVSNAEVAEIIGQMPLPKLEDVRILVVDNDQKCCELIRETLRGKVRDVALARNSRDAIKMYENTKYSIVIVNVVDDVVNGISAIRQIRDTESGYGFGVPIVAVVEDSAEFDGGVFHDLRVNSCLEKPFTSDKLMHVVNYNLGL